MNMVSLEELCVILQNGKPQGTPNKQGRRKRTSSRMMIKERMK